MSNYFNEKALHSVDPKGRLLLPKDVRDQLKIRKGQVLHLVPNLANPPYLEMRTTAQWDQYRSTLMQQLSSEQKKDAFRYTMMLAETATVDGQGRIVLPQRLRDACKLEGSVAVINMHVHLEVWCKAHMDQRYADMVRAFKETNDRIF